MLEEKLKERLLAENEEFRNVSRLHQDCEKKIQKLQDKPFLTEKEKLEEKDLKKKKLALKDRLYFLMVEYKKSQE